MSRLEIILLDDLNSRKDEVSIIKPKTYEELVDQLGNAIKNIPEYYEFYIIDKTSEEIKIDNEDKYKNVEDILFIREVNPDMKQDSLFSMNYKILSESQQDKLDEKFNCILCAMIIKNENPYLCYRCQKIFHIKCLDDWENKCKQENKKFVCPNCRDELPKEQWNKKVDYEGSRKDKANLMNKMKEIKFNNTLKKNINMIKDKKIDELKNKETKQEEIIKKQEKYITKLEGTLKNILNKINSKKISLNNQKDHKLNELLKLYPINLRNLNIDDISSIINEELDQFLNEESHKKISFEFQNSFYIPIIHKEIQPIIQINIQPLITKQIQPLQYQYIQPIHIPNANQYGIKTRLTLEELKSKNIIDKDQLIKIEEIFEENKKKFNEKKNNEYLENETEVYESGRVDIEQLKNIGTFGKFQNYILKITEHYNKTILKITKITKIPSIIQNYVEII